MFKKLYDDLLISTTSAQSNVFISNSIIGDLENLKFVFNRNNSL